MLIVVSRILSVRRAPDTNSCLEKTSKVHFLLQILIKVVSAFHSGVFSCLLAWVITIMKKGFGGYIPDANLELSIRCFEILQK